ncbi:MAG: hypothetical protein LBR52_06930 [Prevotellaceae bacterium]|jgi:hypothetical protein|nr:hypothetical protein [Prevotellaceae bacterium]
MKQKIIGLENDFSAFVQYGRLILNCTEDEIKKHFPENQVTDLPGLDEDMLLEIRLNQSTLTCLIDKKSGVCCAGFLFFDDEDLFNVYREVCNDRCEMIAPKVWKYDNYYIELKESKDVGFYFAFGSEYNVLNELPC